LRKADRIICRLARLTFHQLARTSLQSEEARLLKSWESDCARLVGELDRSAASLAGVIQGLLARFAQSLEWARPGGIRRQADWPALPAGEAPPSWPSRGPAARRFARLIAADLTALLRIERRRFTPTTPWRAPFYCR
jgi:hypothetical protein